MNTLVAWSGGLDSTALIDYLLKKGDRVSSIYIEVPGNGDKCKREQRAIDRMTSYFSRYSFEHLGTTTISPYSGSVLAMKQPLLWLTGLVYALNSQHDSVAIGYVMGDCAISYLPDIRSIWDSFSALSDRQLPPLTFPLIKKDKTDLWKDIPDEVKPHITWCESHAAIIAPCGECHPCRRALFEGIVVKEQSNDTSDIQQILVKRDA